MSDSYESRVIEYEHERNKAMQSWFDARPDVPRNRETERLWEGGFRMAWESRDVRFSTLADAPKARQVIFELPPMRVKAFWCPESKRWVTCKTITIDYVDEPARFIAVAAKDNG